MLKKLVEYIVKSIVIKPEDVTVAEQRDDQKTVIKIHVCPDDMKRVIGKDGRIIKSIRSLAGAMTPAGDVEITLDSVQ